MTTRTLTQTRNEIEYCIRLYAMHSRFHANAAKWVTFIELAAGSAACVSAIGDHRTATVVSSVLIALMAAANHAWSFGDRARDFRDSGRALSRLLAESEGKTAAQLDAAAELIRAEAPHTIEGLRLPAHNDMLRQTGQESHVRPLSPWQWVMSKIA
jgi:hypothetical protein